jgi:hypothetical protein
MRRDYGVVINRFPNRLSGKPMCIFPDSENCQNQDRPELWGHCKLQVQDLRSSHPEKIISGVELWRQRWQRVKVEDTKLP